MPVTQDHKRVFDGDKGLNTGGMGAYGPTTIVSTEILQKIIEEILEPTIRGLNAEGITYIGVLYVGIMLTTNGPKVLEFNCRFGDPETQVILPLLETDLLLDIIESSLDGTLDKLELSWQKGSAVTVVLASGGYPEAYEKGKAISGLDNTSTLVFHAGTQVKDGNIVTSGGRVLNVVGVASNLKDALQEAYNAIKGIHFEKMHYRQDIGAKALQV